jgi:hypothetical protein
MVGVAELVRGALEGRGGEPGEDVSRWGPRGWPRGQVGRGDQEEGLGELGLGAGGRGEAEEGSEGVVAEGRELLDAPAEQGGGVGDRGDGVAEVVLAVAEGALAVLPGLAPRDRGEAEQEGVFREGGGEGGVDVRREDRAALEGVEQRAVVVEGWLLGQVRDRRGERVDTPRSGGGCRSRG